MRNQKIIGENCFNCLYINSADEPVNTGSLNEQGGLDPASDEEMGRAKKADLITLPGGDKFEVSAKRFCNNDAISMYVTARMCCSYWDNGDVVRPWKKPAEPQYIDEIL